MELIAGKMMEGAKQTGFVQLQLELPQFLFRMGFGVHEAAVLG